MALIKIEPYIIDTTGDFTFNNVTATGNLSSLNANLGNAATANFFIGSGANLTNLPAGNVSGQVANALVSGTVYTNAQPNITSVGTLTSLTATGNVTGGNLTTSGNVNAPIIVDGGTGIYLSAGPTGYINFFTTGGDKASISDTGNIIASNLIANSTVFATTANISGNVTAGNVYANSGTIGASLLTGTLTTAAQPNITSVGTLTGITSTGTANLIGASNVALGPVANVHISGGTNGYVLQTDGSGTLSWVAQAGGGTVSNISNGNSNVNIPSANGNINLTATGNTTLIVTGTGANIAGYATVTGNLSAGNITAGSGSGGNITGGNVISANTFTASANITAQYYIGNGSLLTGVATSGLSNGNSNINIPSANGNILVTVAGTANIVSFTDVGLNVGSGSLTRPTNVHANSSLYAVSNADAPPITIQNRFATGYSSMDIINSANVFMGAVGAANPSATTVTALANRAYLYGATGASGVGIYATTGNVTISAASNANIMTITGTGANVSGTFNVTGNANVGNLGFGSGNIIGTGVITGGNAIFGTNASAGLYTFPLAVRSNTANNGSTFGVMNENPNGYSIAVFYNNAAAEMGAVGFANPSTPYFSNAMYLYSSAANGLILSANIGAAPGTKNLWITNAGLVTVPGTTAATSTTSGAFQVTGGAGIGGNLFTGNANLGNAVTANFFIGSGNNLSNIQGANVSGQVGNALVSGTVYTNAQPNITSVGTLTSLAVTGNTTSGNLIGPLANGNSNVNIPSSNGNINLTAVGNTTLIITGTGANITGTANISGNLSANNITAGSGSGGNITGGNLVSANYFTGTLTTAAQPNITSVGSLTGLTVSNATGVVNFTTTANVTLGGVGNLHIAGGTSGYVLQTDGAGTLSWVAQSGGGGSTSNISNGNSNVSIAAANGNITMSAVGNANIVVVTGTGVNVAGTLNVTGQSNLGAVGNVKITGGTANYILNTDGAGNLSWVAPPAGANVTVDNFTGNGVQTVFTLSTTPTGINQTSVNYNGATVLRTDYSLAGANITFSSAPANGSLIEVTTINLTSGSGGGTSTAAAVGYSLIFGG